MTAASNSNPTTQNAKEHEKSKKHEVTKGHDNLLVTEPKDMEICDLLDKELKIAVLSKLRALQDNRERRMKSSKQYAVKSEQKD